MNVRDRQAQRARIAADVGLGAVFAVALVGAAVAVATTWGGGYWQFGCAAGAVVCVTALLRRRHRTWAAVAGLAVAGVAILVARLAELPAEPGPAMALALSVLVGSAVRALPARVAGVVAAGGFAVVAGSGVAALPAPGVPAVTVLNLTAWLAALAVALLLRRIAARRRAIAENVRRDERLDLARELHDVVAHHITGIVVQAQAAQLVARKHPDRLDGSLAGIEAAGSDALAAMRRVVGLLRDTDDVAPAMSPGLEQLSDLVRRFGGHGPDVRLHLPDDDDDDAAAWPPEVTSTVYRVVQESLTNISRHARHAHAVTVGISQDRDAVTVEVTDDAAPASARRNLRRGYGLVGMRERVEALGGALHAGPQEAGGWSVRATMPIPAGERR
ncbi:histidine kinase [Actinopolymorpha sp. B11F2]|uniref:sensor histidine kinase n=1 Tax=Actinopolymorpha sp. B11F2 TaxID=3160862 RepID=UPI0032E48334